jgi:hypothetical protein
MQATPRELSNENIASQVVVVIAVIADEVALHRASSPS